MINVDVIKQIREETGAGFMDVKAALSEAGNDVIKAKKILKLKGLQKANKKAEREIKAGRVFAYTHGEGSVSALVKMGCETDFVAKNKEFVKLGNEIAMQVAAMSPESVKELLDQDYIRDSNKKVKDLISEVIAKVGENISIVDIARLSL